MLGVGRYGRHSDQGTAVQVQVARLGDGHLELAPQLGHDGPHHGPFLLQRVDVAEQHVQLKGTHEHR
jgi:hypothetical protein